MVTRVAIIEDGVLWAGNDKERHHHIIHKIYLQTKKPVGGQGQGFLNDKGEFLTRAEAAQEALRCGQVITGEANIKHVFNGRELFSEDLW